MIDTLQERDHDNEHFFLERFSDRVRSRSAGKNAVGVVDRTVAVARRVQMERADIAKQVRLTDPDVVAFHTDDLARLGVIALHGTRAWMVVHRYASRAIPRGVIKRMAYSRISTWMVPDARGKTVVQAVGIDEERIKVVQPFFRQTTPTAPAVARQRLGLPDKKTLGVIEPGLDELVAIRPVLFAMRDYDQGYTLAIVDPDEEVVQMSQALAAQTNDQAVVITREPKEDVFGAIDATVNLNWEDNISVDAPSIDGMLAAREVIALNSINSQEHVGGDLISVPGRGAAEILPVLKDYVPNNARRQRLRQRAESRFGMGNITAQLEQYRESAAARSRPRSRLVWVPDGDGGRWVQGGVAPVDQIWMPFDSDGNPPTDPTGLTTGAWVSGPPSSVALTTRWVPGGTDVASAGVWQPKSHLAGGSSERFV